MTHDRVCFNINDFFWLSAFKALPCSDPEQLTWAAGSLSPVLQFVYKMLAFTNSYSSGWGRTVYFSTVISAIINLPSSSPRTLAQPSQCSYAVPIKQRALPQGFAEVLQVLRGVLRWGISSDWATNQPWLFAFHDVRTGVREWDVERVGRKEEKRREDQEMGKEKMKVTKQKRNQRQKYKMKE